MIIRERPVLMYTSNFVLIDIALDSSCLKSELLIVKIHSDFEYNDVYNHKLVLFL